MPKDLNWGYEAWDKSRSLLDKIRYKFGLSLSFSGISGGKLMGGFSVIALRIFRNLSWTHLEFGLLGLILTVSFRNKFKIKKFKSVDGK